MAQINYLTTIDFDFGAIRCLPTVLPEAGINRPMIVTDPGIVRAGILNRIRDALPSDLQVVVFEGTPPNPTEEAVEAAAAVYRSSEADGLLAVGGGSSIDLAKAVSIMVSHAGPLAQYAAILGGAAKIRASVAPVVAVPTTAGTGSEVGRGALITLRDGRKLGFLSPHLIPRRAVCDPELTEGLPPLLTAATGMDALTHCIETFLSPRINPVADAIALDGAARAWRWIGRAVADNSDREARWHMMMASLQGGLTFQKGLGAVHSMSHPLGAVKEPILHHGTLNAVILPVVVRFNEGHVGDKYDRLRGAMGLGDGADLADAILKLNARLGLPANLRAMGVPAGLRDQLVAGAMADHSTATNPRAVSMADFYRLFEAAMG